MKKQLGAVLNIIKEKSESKSQHGRNKPQSKDAVLNIIKEKSESKSQLDNHV